MLPTDVIIVGAAALFGLALLGTGLYIASVGVRRVRMARALREAGPTALRDVPGASGLVEVEGVARASDEGTLEAPVSDTACLAYTVHTRSRDGEAWHLDGRASASVPFAVDDGLDRVTVDPTNAVLSLDDWGTTRTAWTDGSDLADTALNRLDAAGLPGPEGETADSSAVGHRQYRERRLDPGDDVNVFGGSVVGSGARDGGPDSPVTVGGDDWFEISVGDESSVVPDRHRSGSLYVIFGGLVAIPGLGFTLAGVVGLVSTLLL